MFVLGLTGSIGMGKSTTAAIFRRFGVPVHDADLAVHRLYAGEAAALIEQAFPGSVVDGVVDRGRLGAMVLGQPARLQALEGIVHPLVRDAEAAFLETANRAGVPLAVLDVPLLLEAGGADRCDAVLLVSAPPAVQRQRVLERPGMTEAKFQAIRAKQLPEAEKRGQAHFIVDTSRGVHSAEAQVRSILAALAGRPGRVMSPLPRD
jgi:dephospho-CoA kinase